jgi:hypothetical protein
MLIKSLEKFDSVTLVLQREGMSFVESREIVDPYYIGEDALIVDNELFEKAVMKIACSLPLSEEQEALVVPLITEESPTVVEPLEVSSSTSKEHGAHYNDDDKSYSEALQ